MPRPAPSPIGEKPARRRGEPALSPSRAADFKQCPLLYRFRAIDRLPELPTRAQLRGTLVHAVLERLYDLPAQTGCPRRPTRWSSRSGRGCAASCRSCSTRCSPARTTPSSPNGWRRRTRCWTPTSGWRIRARWSLRRGSCSSRRSSRQGCCCAATSTGSMSPPRAGPDGRLQDRRRAPPGRRGPRAVPDEVLRAGAAASARRRARAAAAALPHRRRIAHLRAR